MCALELFNHNTTIITVHHTDVCELRDVSQTLTEKYHDGSVYHVPCVPGRVTLDAAISPEVASADLGIFFALVRLKYLWGYEEQQVEHSFST